MGSSFRKLRAKVGRKTNIDTITNTNTNSIAGRRSVPQSGDTTSNNSTNRTNTNNTKIVLRRFCTETVPDFAPLGGSRPDAAVLACVAVWEEEEKGAEADVILPPDVLDTALAMICAPLIVKHVGDLRGREAHFMSHTASVILQSIDEEVMGELKRMTVKMLWGGLSVAVELQSSITEICQDGFMLEWDALSQLDLRRTSLQRIGDRFLNRCQYLTAVALPLSLTEVRFGFLAGCSLRYVDMRQTALHTVREFFAVRCLRLTTVYLPDTVTEVGRGFLSGCGHVEVISGSNAVQAAAADHNAAVRKYKASR